MILNEAHHACRRNLGENRDHEAPDPNNLLRFMYALAERTRTLLLATPVQLRPVEAWDLLDVLSRSDHSVLGDDYSRWRKAQQALALVMGGNPLPTAENERWEWIRNPLSPRNEARDFEIL